jgi:hypothetical protein
MCRSIKILRAPYAVGVTDEDLRAAALQYVRTVSGFRLPPGGTAEAFDSAVETIITATRDLLAVLPATAGDPAALPAPALPWVASRVARHHVQPDGVKAVP